MLSNESETIFNFFKTCRCQPPLMQEDAIIEWSSDQSYVLFPSKTSIISERTLAEELEKLGFNTKTKKI